MGVYKLQVENRGYVVCTKYFYLNNNEINVLEQIFIAIDNLGK